MQKQLVKSFFKIPVLIRLFIDSSWILQWLSLHWNASPLCHVYRFSANSGFCYICTDCLQWRSNLL